jgi:hypothetical protein
MAPTDKCGSACSRNSFYVSYGQFFAFDSSAADVVPDWTESHERQGFARSPLSVTFSTLVSSGFARLHVHFGPADWRDVDATRVIQVPFECKSGSVTLGSPTEISQVVVPLPPGSMVLTVAQGIEPRTEGSDETLSIWVWLQSASAALNSSTVLLADESLAPESPLVEDCTLVPNSGGGTA